MLIQILSRTPWWVWALLCALLVLGLWQSRARRVRRAQILALPAVLLAMGLWTMAPTFVAQPAVAVAWLVAGLAALSWARRWAPSAQARWSPQEQRLHLPGSWVPLLIIGAIFSLRYSAGVGLALHPEWRSLASAQIPLALAFGTLSGLFLGRALGLWALTREPAALSVLPARAATPAPSRT